MNMRQRLFLTTAAIVIGGGCLISWKVFENRKTDAIVNALESIQKHPVSGVELSWSGMSRSGDAVLLTGVHAGLGGVPMDADSAVITAGLSGADIHLTHAVIKAAGGVTEISSLNIDHIPAQNPNPEKDPLITLQNMEGVHVKLQDTRNTMGPAEKPTIIVNIGTVDADVKDGKLNVFEIRDISYKTTGRPEHNVQVARFMLSGLDMKTLARFQKEGPSALRTHNVLLTGMAMDNLHSEVVNITNARLDVNGRERGHFEITGISITGDAVKTFEAFGIPVIKDASVISDSLIKDGKIHVATRISVPQLVNIRQNIDMTDTVDPTIPPNIIRTDIGIKDLGGIGTLIEREARKRNMTRQMLSEEVRSVATTYLASAGVDDRIGLADRLADFTAGTSAELNAGVEMKNGEPFNLRSMQPPVPADIAITEPRF